MAVHRHSESWRHARIDWVTLRSKPGLLTSNVASLSQADPAGAGYHCHNALDTIAVAVGCCEKAAFELNSSGGGKVRSLHRSWDLGRMMGSPWGQ